MFLTYTAAYSVLAAMSLSLIPIVVWLVFWLSEDWRHPEPRQRLLLAFVAGMAAVVVVLPLQMLARYLLGELDMQLLIVWAMIEEVVKLGAAAAAVLWYRSVDEPIDVPIYMITVALGFAAAENTLFLYTPLIQNLLVDAATVGNLRFIGPTLIHVVASACIGTLLAYTFYRPLLSKIIAAGVGVILATTLHAFFNFLILHTEADRVMTALLAVWMGTIFVLVMLEKVKLLHRPAWWESLSLN